MSEKCAGCGKTVYFAEKITAIKKTWHKPCLRCEKCKKTLQPGKLSEHDDKPYCNIPCYSALFGPKGYGHGGTESHSYEAAQKK
ncbi:cysteine-rich protein 1-like [Ciona intestinalis]